MITEQQSAELRTRINQLCAELGLPEVGYFVAGNIGGGMRGGVSVVLPLSVAVVDEVAAGACPTHSYFHHYRTVNAHLDSCMLRIGLLLGQAGVPWIAVGASQSIPTAADPHGYHGRFPHKRGACLAGLGCMGSSGLFLHPQYGPRVRLGTVLVGEPLVKQNPVPVVNTSCAGCMRCRDACPAAAITGTLYNDSLPEFSLVDPSACSSHMKRAYQHIGRGAVCGVCMAVCPVGRG